MKLIILSYLLFLSLFGFSQESDTVKVKQKFEFEKFNSGKIKKIKQGKYLEVVLNNKDTAHIQSGDLIDLNDSLLTINMSYEYFKIEKENCNFKKSLNYEPSKRINIKINSIDYLSYESFGVYVASSIGGISLLTALIIAPLVSIDRSESNNFNLKRYTSIMAPALIGTAVGLTIYYTFGEDAMLKIKLPQ